MFKVIKGKRTSESNTKKLIDPKEDCQLEKDTGFFADNSQLTLFNSLATTPASAPSPDRIIKSRL